MISNNTKDEYRSHVGYGLGVAAVSAPTRQPGHDGFNQQISDSETSDDDYNYSHNEANNHGDLEGRIDHLIADFNCRHSASNRQHSDDDDSENSKYEQDHRHQYHQTPTLQSLDDSRRGPLESMRSEKLSDLVKKTKNLTIALEKEKALNGALNRHIKKLDASLKAGGGNSTAAAALEMDDRERSDETRALKERVSFLTRKLEDEKLQSVACKRDLGVAVKILKQEIGPYSNLADLLKTEGKGWKGRAQQISLLKDKVRDLESRVSANLNSDDQMVHLQSVVPKPKDAQMETLIFENSQQREEVEKLKHKNQGAKARIRILEEASADLRKKMAFVLEKTAIDDEVISKLSAELGRLRK